MNCSKCRKKLGSVVYRRYDWAMDDYVPACEDCAYSDTSPVRIRPIEEAIDLESEKAELKG